MINEGCTDEDHDQFWCLTNLTTRMWGNCGSDCKTKGMFLGGIIDINTLQNYTGKVHWKYNETVAL